MNLTKEQLSAVDEVIAQHVGQWSSDPLVTLEKIVRNWSKESRAEAFERLYQNVFYCETCGNYCDAGERHAGDLCDECHDAREEEGGE